MDKPWLASYPADVPHEINPEQYASLTQLLDESFRKNASRPFSVCMERWMTYGQLDNLSAALSGKAEPQAALDNIASKWKDSIAQAPLSFPYQE